MGANPTDVTGCFAFSVLHFLTDRIPRAAFIRFAGRTRPGLGMLHAFSVPLTDSAPAPWDALL